MKTIVVLTAVICCWLWLSATACAEQTTINLPVRFSQSELRTGQHYLADNEYDTVSLGDLDHIRTPGHPSLPIEALSVYVPRGWAVGGVTVRALRSRELPGRYAVLPAQHEIPIGARYVAEQVPPDPAIYSLAEPYPPSPVALSTSGSMAGRSIAGVNVFPLQYIPAEGKLILNEEIELALELVAAGDEPLIPRETEQVRALRNRIIEGLVENPEDVIRDFPSGMAPLDPSVATEYLILCLEAHADEYEILTDWKTRKGVPARTVTIESVSATYPGRDVPEQLRNCIMDYYLNDGTLWVVMTLAAPKAQIRGCYGRVGGTIDTDIPCDLYFADMDGDWNLDDDAYWGETGDDVDLYPDVYVGRLTANKGVQCSTVIDKILTYEGCYYLPTDYQLDMLFMGGLLDEYTDEAVLKNTIDSESVPSRFDPITKLYESSGTLTKPNVMAELNAGPNIVNHADHGNVTVLEIGTDALYGSDVETLTNAPRYSVFYTTACDPGAFDIVTGCFARSYLGAGEGGGFIVANSRYGWYASGSPGQGTGDRYDREFFETLFDRGYTHLGVTHADAKVQRIPYSGSYGTSRWTMFALNLFGDPETHIWVDTPIAMEVAHPETIDTGSQTFTVAVTAGGSPLNDARICLWKGEEIYLVAETPPSGEAPFPIAPADSGEMLVTVVKDGYVPYLGSAYVGDDLSGVSTGTGGTVRLWARVAPNPVTGSAVIRYALPALPAAGGKGPVARIYDASGRLVRSLTPAAAEARDNAMVWDGRLASGSAAPPGIYFLRLAYGDQTTDTKFVILK